MNLEYHKKGYLSRHMLASVHLISLSTLNLCKEHQPSCISAVSKQLADFLFDVYQLK